MRAFCAVLAAILLLSVLAFPCFAAEEGDLLGGYTPEEGLTADEIQTVGGYGGDASLTSRLRALFVRALDTVRPSVVRGVKTCALLLAAVLLCGMFPQEGDAGLGQSVLGALAIAAICTGEVQSMLRLGTQTAGRLRDYAALLIPVMTGLLSTGGETAAAAAAYTGAMAFLEFLVFITTKMIVPLTGLMLAISTAEAALNRGQLQKLADLLKWAATGVLKLSSTAFTAYFALTGVLASAADSVKMRAARMTISGAVPVVGGIVSDASGTLLTTAAMLRGSVGTYGMLALLGIGLSPFLEIGVQYLLLKLTVAIAGLFAQPNHLGLLERTAGLMGILLAATGVCTVMLLLIVGLCMKAAGV